MEKASIHGGSRWWRFPTRSRERPLEPHVHPAAPTLPLRIGKAVAAEVAAELDQGDRGGPGLRTPRLVCGEHVAFSRPRAGLGDCPILEEPGQRVLLRLVLLGSDP